MEEIDEIENVSFHLNTMVQYSKRVRQVNMTHHGVRLKSIPTVNTYRVNGEIVSRNVLKVSWNNVKDYDVEESDKRWNGEYIYIRA